MKSKTFLFGCLIITQSLVAQSLDQHENSPRNEEVMLVVETKNIEHNLSTRIPCSLLDQEEYARAAPLAKIYLQREFISPERDEKPGVETRSMPYTHRNTLGLNRKVITYSDLYYSPLR